MKALDIVRMAIASTFRSKARTALTVVAIFIGAFTLTITSAIGTGVSDYITTQIASIGADNVLTVTKTASATTATGDGPAKYTPATATGTAEGQQRSPGATDTAVLTSADITAIGRLSGVKSVAPSATVSPDYIRSGTTGTRYVVTVNANSALTKADLAAGAQLGQNSTKDEVLIPTEYVKSLGYSSAKAAVGGTVTIAVTDYAGTLHTRSATIVGVQNSSLFGSGVSLNDALTTALRDDTNIGRPSTVKTSYRSATVTFDAASTTAQVDALKHRLTAAGYTGETVADQLGTFQTVINGIVGVLDAFAVIALLAAGFGIVNTLLMSVQERTREIGLMKAMGMGGGRVFALFSTEAIFIGFLGSALGAAIATGIGTIISRVLGRSLLSSLPGLHIMVFTPSAIAVIILVVMLIAFLAGTLPAQKAARQDPIASLRYE